MPEQQFRTSFIPKKPAAPITRRRGPSVSIFMLIGVLAFLTASALAVGVFFYREYIQSNIVAKAEALEKAREAFDEPLIRELQRLDARIDSANDILDRHIALSAFFDVLEATTLKTVQFRTFSFRRSDGGLSITMEGVARSFSSVALQSDLFGANRSLQGPLFSNLNIDAEGNATFSFQATLDPSLVSYRAFAAPGTAQ